jgi:hypothetical protein
MSPSSGGILSLTQSIELAPVTRDTDRLCWLGPTKYKDR